MKKKLIISSSIVALALSVCLFVFSVFAVGHNFSVNNTLVFVGAEEYMVFDLDAEITGTTKDGDEALKNRWEYDWTKETSSSFTWSVPETLTFNTVGVPQGKEYILYSFTIYNKSLGKQLKVYIEEPDVSKNEIDNEVLKWEIDGAVGSEKIIAIGETKTVTFKLMPKSGQFSGERNVVLNLNIESVD